MKSKVKIPDFVLWSAVLAIIGSTVLTLIHKGDESLFFNNHNNIVLDYFFATFTHSVEFPLIIVLILLLWYLKGKKAFFESAIALSVTALVVQLLKRVILEDNFRPRLYFEHTHQLRLIEFTQPLYHFSFPSGHTTAAFCLLAIYSFYTEKKWQRILLFSLAILIGISRMYLLHHFLSDVVAGILLGAIIAWSTHFYFSKLTSPQKN
ncbi:MAG: phosphatase PAP2 family protein [Chitinophagales bacterium]|nr:phosphatase PAP2 family protein [Chitinophagales bacterium]MCO5279481.1 phosphatase PAP2 family protein [Chitinophagales bacterium]